MFTVEIADCPMGLKEMLKRIDTVSGFWQPLLVFVLLGIVASVAEMELPPIKAYLRRAL